MFTPPPVEEKNEEQKKRKNMIILHSTTKKSVNQTVVVEDNPFSLAENLRKKINPGSRESRNDVSTNLKSKTVAFCQECGRPENFTWGTITVC